MNTRKLTRESQRSRFEISDEDLQQIVDAIAGIQFGSVSITIQDGKLIQIDRTEKRRVRQTKPQPSDREPK